MSTTVTFAGNLAADPALGYTNGGKPVAEFRVIVNRRVKDADGNWTDGTPTGHNCKLYGTAAENLANEVAKGDRVLVHGRIHTETWTDKETGDNRYKDVVDVDEVGKSLKFANRDNEEN